MKSICANRGGEFILVKLRDFCEKISISIKYAAPYMYEKNRLAE